MCEDETAAALLAKHIWRLLKKARHRLYQVSPCPAPLTCCAMLTGVISSV